MPARNGWLGLTMNGPFSLINAPVASVLYVVTRPSGSTVPTT
ncbi:unannotated protein [freshwater metagenome]|uniref:Unannotated protein n=1 Tax=freshwater metagenome TaxID=449393 RepID=A0A6J7IBI4_9ZZZZ